MKNAAEPLEMRGRSFGFAVRRIHINRGRRLRSAPRSLFAGVDPKPSVFVRPGLDEHRHRRVIGEQKVRREHVPGETLVQRLEPPAGPADPSRPASTRKSISWRAKICDCRYKGVWSQYLLTSTWASSAGVARPPAIGRSGASACATVLQVRQAYLGRVVRMTRNSAGTQSSISLTLSPMTCSAPPQQLQIMLSISSRSLRETNGRATGLRPSGPFVWLLLFARRTLLLLAGRGPLSISSSASASWIGIKALGPTAKLRPLQRLDDRLEALDLAVAMLDGGGHIANEMLQKGRFGRQIVEIEPHVQILPNRLFNSKKRISFDSMRVSEAF